MAIYRTSRPVATAGAASAHRGHVHRCFQLRQALRHLELPTGLTWLCRSSAGGGTIWRKKNVESLHGYV